MFVKQLSIYGFKCFGKAVLDLQHPGRQSDGPLELPNVNLVLGDNGGGKSSVLRAVAIAILAPALLESGFVPYRLVRRSNGGPRIENSLLKVDCDLDPEDLIKSSTRIDTPSSTHSIELLARIDRRDRGSLDRLHLEKVPSSPLERLIFDDYSHAFFVVGYGATRRTETGDFIESSARRSRGMRYQRVAGLFEDHVTLRPLQAWLERTSRKTEAIKKISEILPDQLRFDGKIDDGENQYLFTFEDRVTPFTALSDGHRAFIGWVGDLIGHLCDVTPPTVAIDKVSGIVLIDEIDLHLHPAWQRTVVSTLSAAFPRLQFVMTSHSPLIANALRKENIFVTATEEDGTATIKQIGENVFGRGVNQLLLSSYFGLQSTLPPELESASRTLFAEAAEGDTSAALGFLEQLSAPTRTSNDVVPRVAQALERTRLESPAKAKRMRPKRAAKAKRKRTRPATKGRRVR
jgi:hypothetical protein